MILQEEAIMAKKAIDNGLKCPLFILDCSFMREFIEGRILRNRMFEEIMKRKSANLPFQVYTTNSAFQRAILMSDNKCEIHNLKVLISLTKFYSSNADPKNGAEVEKELLKFKEIVSRGDL